MRKELFASFLSILILSTFCRAESAPQAQVVGEKSPIRLTLSVYKTTVGRRDVEEESTDWEKIAKDFPKGVLPANPSPELVQKYKKTRAIKVNEPIWIKIRITNIGKNMIVIADDLFQESADFGETLEKNMSAGIQVYLELTGPDGKKIGWAPRHFSDGYCLNGFLDKKNEPPLGKITSEDPGFLERFDDWRKNGHKIKDLPYVWSGEKPPPPPPQAKPLNKDLFRLKPGQSFTTHSWIYKPLCNYDRPWIPGPIDDYAELQPLYMNEPGEYRLKAIYDMAPRAFEINYYKKNGGHPSEDELRVKTPPIRITVRP